MEIILCYLMMCTQTAKADVYSNELYPIENITAAKIDDNDGDISIQMRITYPNGCFKSYKTLGSLEVDSNEIFLIHVASVQDGLCTMATVKQRSETKIQLTKKGNYQVKDFYSNELLGQLNVDDESVEFHHPSP